MTFSYFIKVNLGGGLHALCSCLHFGQNERILHQNRVEKFFSLVGNSFASEKSDSFWVISRHMCEDKYSQSNNTRVCMLCKNNKTFFSPIPLGK